MATPLLGTESAASAIARVKYSHDAMIDILLQNPKISQNELAQLFGYTVPWVSRIMCSDAFQARVAERKTELVDPTIRLTLEERFTALATKSLDIVMDKLCATNNVDLAMKAMELSTKALGLGARSANVNVQNSFVVALPGKAATAEGWAAAHGPQKPEPVTIDQEAA